MKTFIVWVKTNTAYGYEVKAENEEGAKEKYLAEDWFNIREEEMMVDSDEKIIRIEESVEYLNQN